MRERNWSNYNKQLVQRGSLTFLIDPKIFKSLNRLSKKKTMGRPEEFSDALILLLLMVKIHYKLPYRMLEGFTKHIFSYLNSSLKIPTYSLICKRARYLGRILPKLSTCRPQTVLLDASGLRVAGEGEWKVKVHGRGRPRKWVKVHIAVDPKTQEIVGEILTSSECGDASLTSKLLEMAGNSVKTVIADGAYDRKIARDAIKRRQARALIPPPKNAKFRNDEGERDEAMLLIKGLGGDKQGRSIWGKLTGYSKRALVETAFSRFKRHYGDRMFSHGFERQRVENQLKWYLLNQMRKVKA